MAEELYLVIHLGRPGEPAAEGQDSTAPLLVSKVKGAKGADPDVAGKNPADSIVVYQGPVGWVACDKGTDEVKTLARDTWADLGGWRLKLIEQKDGPPKESTNSSIVENSIVNNSNFLAPYLLIYDSAHAGQPPRRETLPIREGVERLLGRSRAEGRIVIDDRRVSRDHLRFYVEGGAIHVENLSQFPPTLELNGEQSRITGRLKLVHKAKIKIGGSYVEFFNPLDVVPAGKDKPRDSKTAIPTVPAPSAAPDGGQVDAAAQAAKPGAGSQTEGGSDTVAQEGFDWVEKTLVVLAVLLVIWLVYFVFKFI